MGRTKMRWRPLLHEGDFKEVGDGQGLVSMYVSFIIYLFVLVNFVYCFLWYVWLIHTFCICFTHIQKYAFHHSDYSFVTISSNKPYSISIISSH